MNEHEQIMAAARRRSVERHEVALAEARVSRLIVWEQCWSEFLTTFALGDDPPPAWPAVYVATGRIRKAPGVRAWLRRLRYRLLRLRG